MERITHMADTTAQDSVVRTGTSGSKRQYAPPVLIEYGSISKLTQSGGSTKAESGVPQMKMCL
ncbi:MAG: lasso RiPP family leader peptide-containing protein [Vicinamibacterales bacterium]